MNTDESKSASVFARRQHRTSSRGRLRIIQSKAPKLTPFDGSPCGYPLHPHRDATLGDAICPALLWEIARGIAMVGRPSARVGDRSPSMAAAYLVTAT